MKSDEWLIKDYLVRCYNLQNRITPYEANEFTIRKQVREIMKREKCDKLTALKILKRELESKLGNQCVVMSENASK